MISFGEASSPEVQSGGYSCSFVSPPKELQFECSICLHIAKSPRLVSCCGFRFCSDCILKIEKDGNPCPLCKESFTTLPDKLLERTLNEKHVVCGFASCSWVGLLREYDSHLKVCVNRLIECPQKCGGRFRRSCMAIHVSKECPETVVDCEFSDNGCSAKLPRKSMAEHMKTSAQDHVALLSEALSQLKTKQEQLNSDVTHLLDDLFVRAIPECDETYENFEAVSTKVLVRDLPPTADEQKIKCVLGQAGRIMDVNFFPSFNAATVEFLLISSVTNLFKMHHQRPFRLHSQVFEIVQCTGGKLS